MSQTWHIFKKDAWYLRYEIAIVVLAALFFAIADSYGIYQDSDVASGVLLALFSTYLIVRVVQAETIPGDRQFWITRPYRWRSLLAAKLLFILAFVSLPVCGAQLFIVMADRFSLSLTLPGLLWSQMLIFLVVALPIACLAAVTRNLSQFILSILAGFMGFYICGVDLAFHGMFGRFTRPSGPDWISYSLVATAVSVVVALILCAQYRSRRSAFSRAMVIGGATAIGALLMFFPASWEMAAQTWLSPQIQASSVQIGIDTSKLNLSRLRFPDGSRTFVDLALPIGTSGVKDGLELRADNLSATLEWPDGQKLSVNKVLNTAFNLSIWMKAALFNQEREQPAALHVTAYLTLFGNPRSREIPIQTAPANAVDGIQCLGDIHNWKCRAAFRVPDRLVYLRAANGTYGQIAWPSSISYSPFPADLDLSPVDNNTGIQIFNLDLPQFRVPLGDATSVTIMTKEPIAHFRRDVELQGIRLADLHMAP